LPTDHTDEHGWDAKGAKLGKMEKKNMKRKIITIDQDKCNGCGICVGACHEGALKLINGKAKLVSDSYCDGLGACLPECPTGAITMVERDAAAFDEAAVQKKQAAEKQAKAAAPAGMTLGCGCQSTHAKVLTRESACCSPTPAASGSKLQPQLRQWPCQIQLVPVNAPYFEQADLLIAADCSAYAYAGIHKDFMLGRITLIGCPKLDDADYAGKLTEILASHDVRSVTVLRMEVPCCGGIAAAAQQAVANSGKQIPLRIVTIGTNGSIKEMR